MQIFMWPVAKIVKSFNNIIQENCSVCMFGEFQRSQKPPPVILNPFRGMIILTTEFHGKYFLIRKHVFIMNINSKVEFESRKLEVRPSAPETPRDLFRI